MMFPSLMPILVDGLCLILSEVDLCVKPFLWVTKTTTNC
ncbi:hypothetical protein LINGRAPRIM_LOCUS1522 [Linum grandiflorum]